MEISLPNIPLIVSILVRSQLFLAAVHSNKCTQIGPLSSQSPETVLELLACAAEQYNALVGASSSVPTPQAAPASQATSVPAPIVPSTITNYAPSLPSPKHIPKTPPHTHTLTPSSSPLLSPVPEPVQTPAPVKKDFEVLIKIQVKTKGCAKKKAKIDDAKHKFGPGLANTGQSWADFRGFIAKEVGVKEELLAVASMTWRWMKPANSELLPLASENGYLSLLSQVAVSKAKIPYIFVFMDPPADSKQEVRSCLYIMRTIILTQVIHSHCL